MTKKRTKAASERREAERRTKVARAVELLEEGVSGILDSENFRDYLRFMAAFHRYSPNNSLLIYLQRPDATRVAGYKRWQELGRQVRRDEEGLRIFAPRFRKVEPDERREAGAQAEIEGNAGEAREDGEKARILSGFKVVKVFALEQTDPIPGAPPLPEAPRPGAVDSGRAGEVAAAARLETGLKGLLAAERVRVLEEDLHGRYGQYDRRKKEISLRRGMPPVERTSTLCHEAIHHLLHAERSGATEDKKGTREVEAEGAAFAVFSYFGLDTSAFSFAYVANFAGRTEVL
ncbi:MAG: hypothetical protein AVDCRST_MAG05-3065, partial [uncultured Rubrobacteraceae bacterium]